RNACAVFQHAPPEQSPGQRPIYAYMLLACETGGGNLPPRHDLARQARQLRLNPVTFGPIAGLALRRQFADARGCFPVLPEDGGGFENVFWFHHPSNDSIIAFAFIRTSMLNRR